MSLRRRRFTWRGTHAAAGVIIDDARPSAEIARRRVLDAWVPGAHCYRCETGIVLLWPAPRMLDSRYAPGALVLHYGDGFSSVPPPASGPAPGPGVLLTAHHAEVLQMRLDDAHSLDPSRWLAPGPFALAELRTMALPARQSVVTAPVPVRNAREALGPEVPVPDPELAAFRKAMEARQAAQDAAPRGPSLLGRLGAWLRGRGSGGGSMSGMRGQNVGQSAPRAGPGTVARLLERSQLARAVGMRQARYLKRMMKMFDDGNLDEALRHAVPLGGEGRSSLLSLFLPRRRDDLGITTQAAGAVSSLFVGGEELHARLRRTYRAAAERLQANARIAEAAFVLVELLDEVEEAVDLLERHGMLRRAAEIAEGRELPAGRVVRQWLLAGEVQRAIDVARLHGAFHDAIARIEQSHPEQAAALRVRWAEELAQGGDYSAAVEVAWPVGAAREQIRDWVRRGIALGGEAAARLQIRRLVLEPEAFASVMDDVGTLLARHDMDQARERLGIAKALLQEITASHRLDDALCPAARLACRAMLRDAGQGLVALSRRECERLARAGGDALLAADLPSFTDARDPLPPPTRIEMTASDTGTTRLYDAVRLPGGRLLVAEGESGVRLLTRDARTVCRFGAPAESLVISDSGARALALVRRGALMRISRLELDTLKSDDWGMLEIVHWARTYDGTQWIVSQGGTLRVLDTVAERPRCIWQVTDIGGHGIAGLARGAGALHVLVLEDRGFDYWRYEIPGMTLRARQSVPHPPYADSAGEIERVAAIQITSEGDVLSLANGNDEAWLNGWNERDGHWRVPAPDVVDADSLAIAAQRVVVCGRDEATAVVMVRRGRFTGEALRVILHGAGWASVRADNTHVVIRDERSRLLVIDLESLRLQQDLRV